MTSKKLSRREFLRASAVTAAGAALAACQPQVIERTVEVEKVVEKEVEVPVAQTVEVVTEVEVEKTVVVEATAPPPEAQNVIIFVGFGTGTDAGQIEVHESIAEEYNAQSDFHTVEFVTVPWEERLSKFSTMLAADMPPDVCMPIGIAGIASFFDAWADISPYIERDNYDMSRFFGLTVDLHTYPGKGQLGLPAGIFPTVVFYNADLFDAAGVDYPPHKIGDPYADGDPWTYDKLAEVAKLLTIDSAGNDANSPAFNWEDTVQWGWNGWDWFGWGEPVGKFGGNPRGVSDDYKTALYNAEGWVRAWEFDKAARWDMHIRATGEQEGSYYEVAGDGMSSGMIAMWECHSWMQYAYGGWTEAFFWDVGAVPVVEGFDPVAPMHADTFTMVQAAHHKDAAWEVMKWMFQPDILMRLCKNWGGIPADIDLAATWVDDQTAQYPDVDFAVFLDAADYPDVPNHESWKPRYDEVNDAVASQLQLMVAGENLNVQELLDAANAEVQALLDEVT
jgi:multiple sugar transport system substrate-binding protein